MPKVSTSWAKGVSPNPSGRPRVKIDELNAALEKLGKTRTGVVTDLVECSLKWLLDSESSDRLRTYAHDYLARYIQGLPTQKHEVAGGLTPEQIAFVEALKMTPHERRLAQDSTAAEDDAADLDAHADGD